MKGNAIPLLPNPRQVLLMGAILYLALGYLSGSCVRMVAGAAIMLMTIFFWRLTLRISQYVWQLPKVVQTIGIGGGTILYYLSTTMMPAHAVFLTRLCGLMQTVVSGTGSGSGGGISNLITATVNVVRALFILYLAIALIGVFNQMQRDEEWQVAARTPLLAVVIVGIVEAISTLIVPSGVGTC